ncbi:MAG: radical SAM protein, partial [Bacteroidales bacterium]|nr:radical SAM protein [Bacteroidales bacterium]
MRFLWLDINVSYSHTSLALPALHAQIGKDEADVFTGVVFKVLYSTIKKEPFTLLNEILAFKPDFIFSTLWLFNSDYTLRLLRDLKTLNNGVKIVLGGPEFLGNNNSFLSENKHIFAVFRGEGENQFASLASALIKGEGTDKLPGICMLSPEGIYTDNGIAQVKSFPLLKYPESSPFFVWDRAYIQIETSRGCFNRCSFCVSGDCRKIENIDLEEIRRRIENAYRHGVKNIRILDRTFNANSERALQLLELFRDFPEICFHVELHPAFLSPPLKEKLSSLPSSLLHIETGIQSLDDNVLNACRRAGKSRES